MLAVFASLLTLPLIFPHSATSEVPTDLVSEVSTKQSSEGMTSITKEWAKVLEAVAATSTTSTTTMTAPPPPPPPPPNTAAPIRTRSVVTLVPTTTVPPEPVAPPTSQSGLASWYELDGARAGVCAHRTLPFGTVVTITVVKTGTSMTCVVGDRGPFAANLVIDLFRDDFATIAPLGAGVVSVHLTW